MSLTVLVAQARAALADLVAPVFGRWPDLSNIPVLVRQHSRRLNSLEDRMTSTENAVDDQIARGRQIVGLLRAEFASLRGQVTDLTGRLDAEETDDQAQADAAVTQARQADAARVAALIDELATVLPGDVPQVPTPAPGDPATDPGSGTSSDDVLGGDTQADGAAADGPDVVPHAS